MTPPKLSPYDLHKCISSILEEAIWVEGPGGIAMDINETQAVTVYPEKAQSSLCVDLMQLRKNIDGEALIVPMPNAPDRFNVPFVSIMGEHNGHFMMMGILQDLGEKYPAIEKVLNTLLQQISQM